MADDYILDTGKYKFDGIIGSGNFGVVHLLVDKETGEKVALKLLENISDYACREIYVLNYISTIKIPGVVDMVDYGLVDGKLGILMEYIDGYSLGDVIGDEIPGDKILTFMRHMLETISTLHEYDIVHNDITPSNIMFDNSKCKLVLIDFGVACSLFDSKQIVTKHPYICPDDFFSPRCPTVEGKININAQVDIASPELRDCFFEYPQPELCSNLEILKAGDIWALGIVFYSLANKIHIYDLNMSQGKVPVTSYSGYHEDAINAVINACFEKDWTKRTASAVLKVIEA